MLSTFLHLIGHHKRARERGEEGEPIKKPRSEKGTLIKPTEEEPEISGIVDCFSCSTLIYALKGLRSDEDSPEKDSTAFVD